MLNRISGELRIGYWCSGHGIYPGVAIRTQERRPAAGSRTHCDHKRRPCNCDSSALRTAGTGAMRKRTEPQSGYNSGTPRKRIFPRWPPPARGKRPVRCAAGAPLPLRSPDPASTPSVTGSTCSRRTPAATAPAAPARSLSTTSPSTAPMRWPRRSSDQGRRRVVAWEDRRVGTRRQVIAVDQSWLYIIQDRHTLTAAGGSTRIWLTLAYTLSRTPRCGGPAAKARSRLLPHRSGEHDPGQPLQSDRRSCIFVQAVGRARRARALIVSRTIARVICVVTARTT